MGRKFSWMDSLNGSTGSLIDQLLLGAGFLAFLFLYGVTPLWIGVTVGLLIGLGLPVFVHFRFPELYLTAEERDEDFQNTRRFGRKRDD